MMGQINSSAQMAKPKEKSTRFPMAGQGNDCSCVGVYSMELGVFLCLFEGYCQ